MRASIEGVRNIKVPQASKCSGIRISRPRVRPIERNRGAARIACNSGRERRIVYPVNCAYVENVVPSDAKVVRGCNRSGCAGVGKSKINTSVVIDSYRRIVTRSDRAGNGIASAILNRMDCPGYSIILRYDHRLRITALPVWNIDCSVDRRDLHVTMQATTGCQVVDRHRWSVGRSAVIAPRAQGRRDVLRAVIDRVLISRWRRWDQWRVIPTTADCLVVDRRCDPARLVWHPGNTIVVRMRDLDGIGTEQR